MNKFTERIQGSIVAALLIAGGIVGGAIAFAQESADTPQGGGGTAGIVFPVAELGNCTSKEACHAYCDESAHMGACIAFAKAHGLMNKEEAARSEKFSQRLSKGETPGGCDSPASCNTYCSDTIHLDECMTFAEKHDIKGDDYERSKRLRGYLKQGGTMPGGCTSRASCEAYCSDFTHAEECSVFAERAGVADDMGNDDGKHGGPSEKINPEQLKRLGELTKKGETPGGCTNKDACMAYCEISGHMEECIAFGEKVGFMKKEEVERARKFMKTGGPGGCTSQKSCEAFCNAPENQETCFTFAKENGLIPPEDLERMKDGWVRMRQGLDNAPSEVRECLTSTMGATVIEDIQSGKLVPGPAIGERVRDCFEKFGASHDPGQMFTNAPPEIKACLKEKLGEQYTAISSGKMEPTPGVADAFRVCFQQGEFERGGDQGGAPGIGGQGGPNPEMVKGFLRSAPPEVAVCLKEKLGDDFDKLQTGAIPPTPDLGEKMKSCFSSFRPGIEGEGMMRPSEGISPMEEGSGFTPPPGGVQGGIQGGEFINRFPPAVTACLTEKLGADVLAKLGQVRPTLEQETLIRSCLVMMQNGMQQAPTSPTSVPMPPQEGTYNMGVPNALPPGGTIVGSELGWVSRLPGNVQACLKEKYGERLKEIGMMPPTPEIEMVMKACFTMSGGTLNTSGGMYPATQEGTSLPPPPTTNTAPQSRGFVQSLLGAVASSFTHLWGLFR
jgi:hypothetical protein